MGNTVDGMRRTGPSASTLRDGHRSEARSDRGLEALEVVDPPDGAAGDCPEAVARADFSISRVAPIIASCVRACVHYDSHADQVGQAASLQLFDNVCAVQFDSAEADSAWDQAS